MTQVKNDLMCDSRKSIQEVERAVEDVQRPMRWDSAEKIAKRMTKAVLDSYVQMEKDLYKVLDPISEGKIPSYRSLLSRRRAGIKEGKKRNITEQELSTYITRLLGYLRLDQVEAIVSVFDSYLPILIEYGGELQFTKGIFNRYIAETLQDGYDNAYERLDKAARSQGARSTMEALGVSPGLMLDQTGQIARNALERGFQLISNKVTIDAKGTAIKVLVEGLENGLAWDKIALDLHESVGVGYHWHWKRLIRTEMTAAYYESFIDRYQGAGIQFVRLSTSMGACPTCIGLKGYYRMGFEPPIPGSTHPNCRCLYVPYFRLPNGATLKG